MSSHGAAATIIDARTVGGGNGLANVLLILDDADFGRPGKGFTVTNTFNADSSGIVIDSNNVAVRGNQIMVLDGNPGTRRGIQTVAFPETLLIEENQVIGWFYGIRTQGAGNVVRRNQLSFNRVGIDAIAGEIVGNLITEADTGMGVYSTTAGVEQNAVYGSRDHGFVVYGTPAAGVVRNNMVGNPCGMTVSSAGLVATNNYWGAASGPGNMPSDPGNTPGDELCDSPGAATTVTPFATKPFNVKPKIKP